MGEIVVPHAEVKRLLDLVRSACKGVSEPIAKAYQPFHLETEDGRDMHVYSELWSRAIRSISGLDDFELIAFLVVQARAVAKHGLGKE